jgi:hypothetical protein
VDDDVGQTALGREVDGALRLLEGEAPLVFVRGGEVGVAVVASVLQEPVRRRRVQAGYAHAGAAG